MMRRASEPRSQTYLRRYLHDWFRGVRPRSLNLTEEFVIETTVVSPNLLRVVIHDPNPALGTDEYEIRLSRRR